MTTIPLTLKKRTALNTGRTGPILSGARITLKTMPRSTPAVFVQRYDVHELRQRIAQLEGELEQQKLDQQHRDARRIRLHDATMMSGSPEIIDGPSLPVLSLRGWFRNRQPSKPSLLRRWYLRR